MCNGNKLIIASAGSGKTTFLVSKALEKKEGRILITTYTQANEQEIRKRVIKLNKCIPKNVTIQPWFSFLLQHGAKPYQGCKFDKIINGLALIGGQSTTGIAESDTQRHYFTEDNKIFSDKLSKFAVACNKQSNGAVINRLSRIYTNIFVDEVQDLSGYDLDFLKLLLQCNINILLVGDPRQGTYSTNNSSKNKKFRKSKIVHFFEDDSIKIERDDSSLTTNYRGCSSICKLSNKLYPKFKETTSGNTKITGHDGVFLVKKKDVGSYLLKFKPMQLRDSIKTKGVNENYAVMTFGKAKGLEFERVLIYPTTPFIKWLKDNNNDLAYTSRSKFYVAITRAFYSVGIVCDEDIKICGVNNFVIES